MARHHVIFEVRIAYRHGGLSLSREKAQPAMRTKTLRAVRQTLVTMAGCTGRRAL
jgi:hypothetical protein